MPRAQDVLREVVALNKRRTHEGLTPLEYQRWLDLSAKLRKHFPTHPSLGGRGETHIRVEYANSDALQDATMLNVHPIGIYANTPFAAEMGAKFGLVVFVKESGEEFRSRVEVVSNNVGPDFSTANLGMGMKFIENNCELRRVLNGLCGIGDED